MIVVSNYTLLQKIRTFLKNQNSIPKYRIIYVPDKNYPPVPKFKFEYEQGFNYEYKIIFQENSKHYETLVNLQFLL